VSDSGRSAPTGGPAQFDDDAGDPDSFEDGYDSSAARPTGVRRSRAPRAVPASVSALVLFLTISTGLGVAAGLIAGPGSVPVAVNKVPVNPNGTGNFSSNPSTPCPGCYNSTSPPGGGNQSQGSNGTQNHTGGGNQTNSTGNGTKGNGTGNQSGNQSGTNNTGNQTGGGGGHNGTSNNGTSAPRNGTNNSTNRTGPVIGGANNSSVGTRNELPWLPAALRFAVLAAAFLGLGGLATGVLLESLAPRVAGDNPWARSATRRRRRDRLRPRIDPKRAIGMAVAQLRRDLETLGDGDLDAIASADVRGKIVRLYADLLVGVGAGIEGLESRTAREIEAVCVGRLEVTAATARELTWLFEEARYSKHPMDAAAFRRARGALGALLVELQRFSRSL
jgi:hypothetical protein